MGKKRSKTAKQRQARATTSKRFGVMVKKGGGREQASPFVLDPKKKPTNEKSRKSLLFENANKASKNQPATKTDEFSLEMRSMEERHAQWSSSKKKKKKGGKKHSFNFAPSAIAVDDKDKSTERLMDETAARVKDLKVQLGQQQHETPPFRSSRLQDLAKNNPLAWSNHESSPLESNNPYAVLEGDDSSEENTTVTSNVSSKQNPFQFAPASFDISTTVSTVPQSEPLDIDPDL